MLAVVAVSGGALRSAVWTMLVLERLDKELKVLGDFGRHVRLITGASGGMLGAAAYVVGRANPGLFYAEGKPIDKHKILVQPQSLGAIAQQLALSDIPSILDPRGKDEDRGRVLEATWHYLQGVSFGTLRDGEYDGRLPSLVFTPMLVEDGRRLLISNLDMAFACECRLSSGSADPAAPADSADDRLLSRPAIELRRVFHERFFQMPVSTAVRISATFPYVSPAVSLPTKPARSVVDAGYYDNFGMNLACTRISEHRDWLKKNTSGVVLIQIRDHCGRKVLRHFRSPSERPDGLTDRGVLGRIRRLLERLNCIRSALAFLSSPLAGYMTSRYSTSSFRNDGQIIELDRYFNKDSKDLCGPNFFKTVLFEFSQTDEVALNWQLIPQEVASLTERPPRRSFDA